MVARLKLTGFSIALICFCVLFSLPTKASEVSLSEHQKASFENELKELLCIKPPEDSMRSERGHLCECSDFETRRKYFSEAAWVEYSHYYQARQNKLARYFQEETLQYFSNKICEIVDLKTNSKQYSVFEEGHVRFTAEGFRSEISIDVMDINFSKTFDLAVIFDLGDAKITGWNITEAVQ